MLNVNNPKKAFEYDDCCQSLQVLSQEFKSCQKVFVAMGDETRQLIILSLLESNSFGIRVKEIMERTNLSRPAVSHHIRVLKNVGIIGMRREGTKNYYYIDYSISELNKIETLFLHIRALIMDTPDRNQEN